MLQSVQAPEVPSPGGIENTSFSPHFDRRFVSGTDVKGVDRDGAGRVTAWMRVTDPVPESVESDEPFLHQCWLAYVSDDLASDTVRSAHSSVYQGDPEQHMSGISLDHTIWFHRPMRADQWHLHDFTCHHYTGARGLAIGHVFDPNGIHIATVAQEVLLREPRVAG
jgi:acyl-CoA thioesterase-2